MPSITFHFASETHSRLKIILKCCRKCSAKHFLDLRFYFGVNVNKLIMFKIWSSNFTSIKTCSKKSIKWVICSIEFCPIIGSRVLQSRKYMSKNIYCISYLKLIKLKHFGNVLCNDFSKHFIFSKYLKYISPYFSLACLTCRITDSQQVSFLEEGKGYIIINILFMSTLN